MTRMIYRFVAHRIKRHPDSEATASARCLHGECGWQAEPRVDVGTVDQQCMDHTGLNREHTTFARAFEDVALVERVEGPA
ncbi:hypothetical protein ACH44C_14505 [Streptomyces purpureus]|uniref:DUF7848 domain-containing protein n=1 Tax=Streptomyces purpureus TaxID=1951 RepID=UPI000491DB68|nr:hypothetical protein [Streptomyces purpureus]